MGVRLVRLDGRKDGSTFSKGGSAGRMGVRLVRLDRQEGWRTVA